MPLTPPNPEQVMVIRDVTKRITTLSVPFWRAGTLAIGGRATIVKMQSGKLAVFSPVALTDTVKNMIAGWGTPVGYIIAPDIEHHIFLGEWHKAYPRAHVIAPDGLKEKRERNGNDPVPFSTIITPETKLTQKIDPDFDNEFQFEYVETHPNRELVFNYKPEKTMIEADLLFNLPATEQFSKNPGGTGALTNWLWSWGSAEGAAWAQKNMIYWLFSGGGNRKFNDSMRRIEKWDFDRIIPCHGEVIETGGKSIFRKLMESNLKGKSESPAGGSGSL